MHNHSAAFSQYFKGPSVMRAGNQIEEELRSSEPTYRDLFETMAQGVVYYDSEARIISANPAAVRILGVNLHELLGRTALDLGLGVIHEDGSGCSTATYPAIVSLKTGRNADGVVLGIFNARERQYRWINMAAVPQFRPGELMPYRVYTTFDDITERRALKEELAQAQKMEALGRLAGGVAHDFNNLLNVISGYSELLLLQMQEGDQRDTVENIRKAAATAASVTGQLLAFSRREVLAPEVLDLNRVVADVARILPRLIGENIEVATVLSPDLGRVRASVGQIEQVLLNLAVNARDAVQSGGKLIVHTQDVFLREGYTQQAAAVAPGWYVRLAISDNGRGMDQNTLSRIFEPYFTTKERGKGTGLGLAAVYGIVDQNGGHIRVESKLGHGTSFEIYLPRVEEAATPEPAKRNYEILRGSETILLVEDSEDLRQMTGTFLRMQGYTVVEAPNGAEAVRAIQRYKAPIHLMLTDVILPGISGPELAKRLASLRPEMKVLYASGYTGDVLQRYRISESNAPFIEKPFSFDFLAQKVREVLEVGKLEKSA
jgi:two-component system, cell cycle sensor histidine kinase and response regulator CckA